MNDRKKYSYQIGVKEYQEDVAVGFDPNLWSDSSDNLDYKSLGLTAVLDCFYNCVAVR